jgi:hypothetical protein
MIRNTRTSLVIMLVLFGASLAAQKTPAAKKPDPPRPNFSGQWVTKAGARGAANEMVVAQDEQSLTHQRPDGSHRAVYQLDGVERRMALPSGGVSGSVQVTSMASAKWDGSRIIIVTNTSYSNGMRTQDKDIWSIDAQGRLVIDTSETGPGAPPQNTRVVFTRKP